MTSEEEKRKIAEVISHGLVAGLGDPVPGQMCIEAAIRFAKGLGHGDVPPCVAEPDRRYAIRINDANWSSPQARAKALLPLALAQLDTAGTDRVPWAQYLALHTVKRVLPLVLKKWPDLAKRCAVATNLKKAKDAAHAAAAYDAYDAYAAAAYAAYAAAAAYAADATDAAYAADAASYGYGDEVLQLSVQIALEAYALGGNK